MRILITGGTGSLGHALVRSFLKDTDWRLVVFSRDELKQAQMHERFSDPRIDFRLGDVRDLSRLNLALHGVDAVVHAAALKRVDAVAGDPVEVFKTNVMGTMNVLQAALTNHVPKVLLISSDKACYATNAYGSSKFAAESLVVSFNQYAYPQGCRASVLRYGNVLGSRGSVVHVWKRDILAGRKVMVTHPDMTRFIVPMPLAVGLVMAALGDMTGGEVFVPRVASAYMLDLLRALWRNMEPGLLTDEGREFIARGGEIGVGYDVTGLRPGGEKMHETLLTAEEATRSRDIGPYMTLIEPHQHPWVEVPEWVEFPRTSDGERRSDTAPKLTVDELRLLLQSVPEDGV